MHSCTLARGFFGDEAFRAEFRSLRLRRRSLKAMARTFHTLCECRSSTPSTEWMAQHEEQYHGPNRTGPIMEVLCLAAGFRFLINQRLTATTPLHGLVES